MLMRLTKTMRLTLTAGVLALPTLALADLPPVLDRVTSDASVVIGASSISEVLAGFEALSEIGFDGLSDATAVITSIEGLNLDGSAALGMFASEDMGMEGPDTFMILPISDYSALIESLDGEAGGISEVFIEGEAAYVADMGGGYAFLGSTKELTEQYADVQGNTGAFESMLGSAGQNAVESSTVFVAANLEQLRPLLEQQLAGAFDMLEGGDVPPQAAAMVPVIRMLGEHLAEEGQSFTIGLGFEDSGITINTSAQFMDGTGTANLLAGESDSSAMLGHLPNKPFFMAMAVDASGALFKAASDFGMMMGQMQAEAMGAEAPEQAPGAIGGYAAAVSPPAGGIMGGLLTSTTTYTATDDPKGMMAMKAMQVESMNAMETPIAGLTGSYTQGATTIAGHEVDAWGMDIEFDNADPATMQYQMMLPMLFGQGGLGGFIAAVDGGVVSTMSKNPKLMEQAIEAATNGGGMSNNESINAVSGYLPSNRAFEFYLGVDEVFTMAGALAAMGMVPMEMEFPEGVAPVAAGFGYSNGGASGSVFIPVEVIEFGGVISAMMNPMGGGDF